MHPIIKELVHTSNSINFFVEKLFDKNSLIEKVFFKILDAKIIGYEQELIGELDQAIIKGHPDANVYLFFISWAIRFTSIRKQKERANAIQSIGDSLSRENIHPIVEAHYKQGVATLKFFEYNFLECNRIAKESLTIIDKSSPRYINLVVYFASILSLQGRIKELDPLDFDLFDSLKNGSMALNRSKILLANCLWTGNYKEGFIFLDELKNENRDDGTNVKQSHINILKIISGDFDENNYSDNLTKGYANSLRFLAIGDVENAKLNFQVIQKTERTSHVDFPFEEYLPLHIELSQKNKGKAKLILQEIEEKRGSHYIDDLFLARIQLLELNKEGAEETFSRLIENVKKYGAMNRLLFELKFAKEMKSSDILLLMSGIKSKKVAVIPISKKEIEVKPNQKEKGIDLLVGESPAISKVKSLVKKFASLKEPVLITGETGTGKELVSRAIHDEGAYPKEPFLAINCGALTESLLQSELFGYVAGAFTGAQKERQGIFEAAGKGTVFLDEFGDISPKMQVSLLRVLESNEIRLIGGTKTRQIECKIVIATNIDLHQAVAEKKFREDLYFRLTRFDIRLPALRDRVEDIPILISYFLKDKNSLNEKQKKLSMDLLETLMAYHWPGNIRELKNEIERLKILQPDKEIINIEDFDFDHLQGEPPKKKEPPIKNVIEIAQTTIEKKIIPDVTLNHNQILEIVQRGSKSDNRKKIIKELFQAYKKLTRIQLVEITSISPSIITKELQNMCEEGFLTKITPTKSVKSTYFVLKE